MAETNPFMDAINEHCTSLISIMTKGTLSFKELKEIQLRFRSFDALLEDTLQDIRKDLKAGMNCVHKKNCPEHLECEDGKDKIFIDDCPSFEKDYE